MGLRFYSQVIRLLDFGVSLVLRYASHAGVVAIVNHEVCAWVTVHKHRSHSTRIWKPLECAWSSSSRTGHRARADSRVQKLASQASQSPPRACLARKSPQNASLPIMFLHSREHIENTIILDEAKMHLPRFNTLMLKWFSVGVDTWDFRRDCCQ